MKLRNKVLLAISCVWLVFIGLSYLESKFFLIRSFLTLEQDRANGDLGRIDQALDQVSQSLFSFTSDWSHWNDLYAYMQGTNPQFVPNNLNMTAYVNSHINVMSFWNKQGVLVLGTGIDTDHQKLIGFPPGINAYITQGSELLKATDPNKELRGYILTKKGIMLIAASTITDGDKALPPLGVMINARELDPALVTKISETTNIPLKLFLPSQIDASKPLKHAFTNALASKTGHYSLPIDDDFLHGYSVLKDIMGKPIGLFQMTTPRTIYRSGVKAVNYYLLTFIVLGVIFSFFMLWLLRILIIKRLEKLDHEVAYIGNHNAIQKRVESKGTDELTAVSQ